MRLMRVQSCLLLRERFSPHREKKVPHIPPSVPQKLFLTPIDFVYSDRDPAIVSDEIIETTRHVEGKISKKDEMIVNRGRKYFKRRDLMEQDDCAEKRANVKLKHHMKVQSSAIKISVSKYRLRLEIVLFL